jgi:hypothetical protein
MPQLNDADAQAHYLERYQFHASAMGDAMREARALIDAGSQSDLEPEALYKGIEGIIDTLHTAAYHTDRMKVYSNLLYRKVKDTQHT